MATAILKRGEGRRFKAGGLWIYDNEIDSVTGEYENGDIVEVCDFNGYFLGRGFFNSHSKIRIRILTRSADEPIDAAFFRARLMRAWNYRKRTVDTGSCRLLFSEADGFPGLVVDKFGDILVVQSLALGIDRFKGMILNLLTEILEKDGVLIRGIYERSDAKVRLKEGMPLHKGFLSAPFETKIQIEENGIKYIVDIENGQKTGFFLDQKYNRRAVGQLCRGLEVLDCFTHTGSFALNAAAGGARRVLGIDASELAIAQARENARLNGFEEIAEFERADVFEYLPALEQAGKQFDLIVLDPPAFTKSSASVKNASRGYREINSRAMRLVREGGFLATCSCSHFMTYELFTKVLALAANDAHKRLRQVEFRTKPTPKAKSAFWRRAPP